MKNLLILLLTFICSLSYGQIQKITRLEHFDKKPIRYGFYLGLHQSGYSVVAPNASIKNGGGFQLGVLADLNISEFVSILVEPGIMSSSNTIILGDKEKQMPTTYFHLPVSLKLSTRRINNVKGFVLGGLSYNYNFSADKNKGDGHGDYDFVLSKSVAMAEVGLGASFYFPYFKFTPSIRGLYGFNNEFNGLGSIARSSLVSLKTRGIFLTLTFQ